MYILYICTLSYVSTNYGMSENACRELILDLLRRGKKPGER